MTSVFKQDEGFDFFKSRKSFALLIDPEKFDVKSNFINQVNLANPDLIFVGGSQKFSSKLFSETIVFLKRNTKIPIVIFPGNNSQINVMADALLVLSLINSSNVNYISGQLIQIATELKKTSLITIPVSYILIDGKRTSSTEKVLNSSITPVALLKDLLSIVNASSILGFKTIYLEAGSGASKTVDIDFIKSTKEVLLKNYLIVGGGVNNVSKLKEIWSAGADCIVVGNAIESHPELLLEMCLARNEYNESMNSIK